MAECPSAGGQLDRLRREVHFPASRRARPEGKNALAKVNYSRKLSTFGFLFSSFSSNWSFVFSDIGDFMEEGASP